MTLYIKNTVIISYGDLVRLHCMWGLQAFERCDAGFPHVSEFSLPGLRKKSLKQVPKIASQCKPHAILLHCLDVILLQRCSGIMLGMVTSNHWSPDQLCVPNIRTCGSSRTEQSYYSNNEILQQGKNNGLTLANIPCQKANNYNAW